MRLSTFAAATAAAAGVFLLASPSHAQSPTFVSPVQAKDREGFSNNVFPWGSTALRRYQQVHSDVALPGIIKGMSFRMNGSTSSFSGTRMIDCEVFMGYSAPYSQMSTAFDANYIATTKVQVVNRKVLNFGPQGQSSIPAPFTGMDVVFDATFPYVPTRSLIWEAVIYSNTANGTWSANDADASSTTSNFGTDVGQGCIATGQTATMDVYQFNGATDMGGIFTFATGVIRAPAAGNCVLAIGTSNPNLVVPGVLCGGLYTNQALTIPLGAADANGTIIYYAGFSVSLPNTFPGFAFYTQIHALDPGLSELIKVANSGGYRFQVPMPDTTREVKVSRMQNNSNITNDPKSSFFQTSTIGYGLVTRFNY